VVVASEMQPETGMTASSKTLVLLGTVHCTPVRVLVLLYSSTVLVLVLELLSRQSTGTHGERNCHVRTRIVLTSWLQYYGLEQSGDWRTFFKVVTKAKPVLMTSHAI
jgi:hypothetical protein